MENLLVNKQEILQHYMDLVVSFYITVIFKYKLYKDVYK